MAEKYRIIDNSTIPLFIYRYNEDSLQLYNEIKDKDYLTRKDYQRIAQYCVQVYERFVNQNKGQIVTMPNGIMLWSGAYSEEYGLSNEDEFYNL